MGLYKRPGSEIWWYEFVLTGKRYRSSTRCTNKREAQAAEDKARKQAQDDQRNERDGIHRMSLYEVAQKWLVASEITHTDHKNNLSRVRKLFGDEMQQRGTSWVLAEGARPGLSKDLMVHEVSQAVLVDLKNKRLTEKNSAGTINRELSLVQALMGYAQSLGVVMPSKPIVWSERRNRAASLKMRETKGKLRWLTLGEERKLIEHLAKKVDEAPKADRAAQDGLDLAVMLLDTGARYEEIAGLRRAQVDVERGEISLYRSKTRNESRLKLPRRSRDILERRMVETRGRSYVFPAHRLTGDGTTTWADEDTHRGHSTGTIQAAIEACGLNDDLGQDKVTPHTFRDTYASRLVQAGVSLLKVSHLLGHANVSMTQKYAHLCPDMAGAEAVAVLDGLHAD
ncbi:site-specific integrase [Caballeronia sp. LZ033]|uniref:tyrosine-type recombinase/integrase n=1 Tax=Caballeronia sp. LZ033 TaxID=3038566 RepID=UPI0028662F59|nr:site-specific integrase [Caballeronia sp. LZ033]MDR5812036.1 site-specific integrase [Caballeronia sp. LZ033]